MPLPCLAGAGRLSPIAPVRLWCGLCLLLGSLAHAANPPITDVLLYPGGATVERRVHVEPGMQQLVLDDLPASFDPQTVTTEGPASVHIALLQFDEESRAEAVNAKEADVQAQIQSLQDQSDALDTEDKSAALVQTYLGRVVQEGSPAAAPAAPAPTAAAVAAMAATLRQTALDSYAASHQLALQKRAISLKIGVLQDQLKRLGDAPHQARRITVRLLADQAADIRIAYQVPGAGWRPGYRARLDSAAASLELERMATISQSTGEDWSNVWLRLSTVQPSQSPGAPAPAPWLLDWQQAPAAPEMRAAVAMEAAQAPVAAMPEAGDAYRAPVQITQTAFATEFEVPERVSLAADGRELAVSLSHMSVPVQERLRVVPQQQPSAFIVVTAARPAGVWLAGDMQLYRDGSYVGATSWSPGEGGADMELDFGRDDLLKVSVDRLPEASGNAGLLGGHRRRQLGSLYTLSSRHTRPVEVELLEATPVSQSDKVKVDVTYSTAPDEKDWQGQGGVVAWHRTLAAGASSKYRIDYVVDYPNEGQLSGLP